LDLERLAFCIRPIIGTFQLEQVDLAYEKMVTFKVRFRAVLTMEEAAK
jgi:D-arabinose 1-dehydrogenase-like Zn-dependent alcohol dehydrogenase